ncbi:MAG TPA: hypothetical protein VK968_12970, partial [Roseimicrobium sp.]|nr:hypothetical protein [Roseimicrobium sp.]
MLGRLGANSYEDKNLKAEQTYQYKVIAYDSAGNSSAPGTATASPSDDETAPNAPAAIKVVLADESIVKIGWSAGTDNVGVTSYRIYRNGSESPVDTTTLQEWTDDNAASPGRQYQVSAVDAAGNESARVSVDGTLLGTQDALATNQYIPQEYKDYFYDDLTAYLRASAVRAGSLVVPHAQHWLDFTAGPSNETIYALTSAQPDLQAVTLAVAPNVVFDDRNHNTLYDASEAVWFTVPVGGSTYHTGQTTLSGEAPEDGTIGHSGVYYADLNGDHEAQTGELIFHNIARIKSDITSTTPSKYMVRDGAIWEDKDNNHLYSGADQLIAVTSAGTPVETEWGKTSSIQYTDANSSGLQLFWFDDSPSFQDDLKRFYGGVEQVASYYTGPELPDGEGWNKGSLLDASGVPTNTLSGSVTVVETTPGTFEVIGSTTRFSRELRSGDWMQIDGEWYAVIGMDDTHAAISGYEGSGASSQPVVVTNWTVIPTQAEDGESPALHRIRGTYAGGPVFKEQFTELHEVLVNFGELAGQNYDVDRYDEESSQQFIAVATKVVNA